MAAKRDKLSKTACRGFKSFCPCHRSRSLQTPKIRRLRAFFMPKSPEWTRSIDTGFPWQNPPNAPIFVNIPTAAVWYIIKKASANFWKRTVLYRVPRMESGGEKKCIFFVQPCCVDNLKVEKYILKRSGHGNADFIEIQGIAGGDLGIPSAVVEFG